MAHFAKISEENLILDVLAFNDSDMLNAEGIETESVGQQYLETHNNWPAHLWIQTSYNTMNGIHKLGGTPFRKNYATIGGTWDPTNQMFFAPKPFPSWVKDLEIGDWVSPIGNAPALTSEQESQNTADTHAWQYVWNEPSGSWNLTNLKD
jgi:hypothetical protein